MPLLTEILAEFIYVGVQQQQVILRADVVESFTPLRLARPSPTWALQPPYFFIHS